MIIFIEKDLSFKEGFCSFFFFLFFFHGMVNGFIFHCVNMNYLVLVRFSLLNI